MEKKNAFCPSCKEKTNDILDLDGNVYGVCPNNSCRVKLFLAGETEKKNLTQ